MAFLDDDSVFSSRRSPNYHAPLPNKWSLSLSLSLCLALGVGVVVVESRGGGGGAGARGGGGFFTLTFH